MRTTPWMLVALAAIFCLAGIPALAQYDAGGGGAGGGGAGGAPGDAPAGNEQQPAPYSGQQAQPMQGGGSGDLFPAFEPNAEPRMSPREHEEFADRVDVSPLRKLAVFHGGRAKILDTLARETMQNIHGRSSYKRQQGDPRYIFGEDDHVTVERDEDIAERSFDPVFTFFDLVFNPEHYTDRPLLHVSHVEVRREIALPLEGGEYERLMREGRVSPRLVSHPDAREAIEKIQADAVRSRQINKVVGAFNNFLGASDTFNIVSPEPGDDRWPHVRELASATEDATADAGGESESVQLASYGEGEGGSVRAEVVETFRNLGDAWRQADHAAVNVHIEELAELLPQIHPETYPAGWRRTIEYAYNVSQRFTYSYVAYFGAFVALLLAFATTWRKPLVIGGVLLAIGFVGHTLGLVTRIVLSDRPWTIHNQFESFFMLTWFAALAGLILLIAKRQWIYGAAAAAISAIMLMVANQAPIPSAEIAPSQPILNTSNILYIHVNIMIISYALIALALIISIFYLWTHYSSSDTAVRLAAAGLEPTAAVGGGGATGEGGGEADEVQQPAAATRGRAALLNDLDQAQMVVIQMVFWLLAVGILLGAYWADHSWGRWWAWDPKETWALILWIVFLVAIHLRVAVKRRGLVTAWLSVFGFFMMLWTHWGVNLLLAGLHSYA